MEFYHILNGQLLNFFYLQIVFRLALFTTFRLQDLQKYFAIKLCIVLLQ